MRRKPKRERIGSIFESIGRAAERLVSKDRDPIKNNVRWACISLIILACFLGLLAVTALFQGGSAWTLLALALDLASVAVAIHAMRTAQPVKSFLWMLVAILLIGLTLATFAVLAPYI